LPFGFIQSPILASVVLDKSLLGKATRGLLVTGIKVSVYMDDFILSGNDEETLRSAMRELEVAAECSNFRFNPSKSIGPTATIPAFNLELAHADLRISNARMAEFAAAIAVDEPAQVKGILGYVGTVNATQRKELEALV
jgi:hypothetical protein